MKLYETINAENWLKGSLHDETKMRWCLGGHLTNNGSGATNEAVNAAVRVLFPERVDDSRPYPLVCFNDHRDTTLEDVIRICKVADV